MGKLLSRLQMQLNTELKQDAEDCLRIYNHLKETTGHVWSSEWSLLVDTKFKGYPSGVRTFRPTSIGYTFLKGLDNAT